MDRTEFEDKSFTPSGNKTKKVKVKIRQNRVIEGVGKAGDVVEMDRAVAEQYEREGFVTIIQKEN